MMKTISSFILIIMTYAASGQQLDMAGNTWSVVQSAGGGLTSWSYQVQNDSIIDSIQYGLVFQTPDSNQIQNWNLKGAIRDSSGFVLFNDFNEEYLLYNFNLDTGDTFETNFLGCFLQYKVISIDSFTLLNGETRLRYQLDNFGNHGEDVWIDGIGSINGLFEAGYQNCITDVGFGLSCFWENDSLIYTSSQPSYSSCFPFKVGVEDVILSESFQIAPNPTSGLLRVSQTYSSRAWSISIMNLNGKMVFCSTPSVGTEKSFEVQINPGLYIVQCRLWNDQTFVKKLVIVN